MFSSSNLSDILASLTGEIDSNQSPGQNFHFSADISVESIDSIFHMIISNIDSYVDEMDTAAMIISQIASIDFVRFVDYLFPELIKIDNHWNKILYCKVFYPIHLYQKGMDSKIKGKNNLNFLEKTQLI